MSFWKFSASGGTGKSATLRIDGDIVDNGDVWLYEWFGEPCASPNAFREELGKVDGMPLTVWIDSRGGDVAAASGIYNALREHKGGVTVKIDGKAMSAASIIAMAGDTIEMGPVALMMIHNPLTHVAGYASDLRKGAEVLDEVREAIVNAYQLKTGRDREKICAMMDDETYMSAKTAIREKFADRMLYEQTAPDAAAENSMRRILGFHRPGADDAANLEREKVTLLIDLV